MDACSNDAYAISPRFHLRDTPQTHCNCKAGNDFCAHVGSALMVIRVVQKLDINSRDEFHRTCPPSVKSLMEYPIPALFANSQKNSLQEVFRNAKNRKFYYDQSDDEVSDEFSDEFSDEVEDEPDDHTDGSRNVEDTVLSFFGDKLQKTRGMDISTDNVDRRNIVVVFIVRYLGVPSSYAK